MKGTEPPAEVARGRAKAHPGTARPAVLVAQIGLILASSLLLVLAMGSDEIADVGHRIATLGWLPVLASAVCSAARLVVEAARWRSLVPGQPRLPLVSILGARVAGFAVNYVTPGIQVGGEVLRAVTLERRHGIPRAEAVASVAADKAVEVAAAAASAALAWPAAAGVAVLRCGTGTAGAVLLVLVPVAGLAVAAADRLPAPLSRPVRALRRIGTPLRDALARLPWRSPGMLAWLVGSSALSSLLLCVEVAAVAHAAGSPIDPASAACAAALIRLASMLIPVPGGVGAQEAATIAVLGAFAVEPSPALAIALVLHARDIGLAGLGLLLLGGRSLRLTFRKAAREAAPLAAD